MCHAVTNVDDYTESVRLLASNPTNAVTSFDDVAESAQLLALTLPMP